MDSLLNLLFLYLLFMGFSSLLKKMTTPKKSQPQQESPAPSSPTIAEDLQTKFRRYTRKIDQYLAQQTAQRPPISPPIPDDARPLSHEMELPAEAALDLPAQEFESTIFLPQPPVHESLSGARKKSPISKREKKPEPLIEPLRNPHAMLRGVILSEILGPPLSQRPPRFQRKKYEDCV